MKEDRTGPELSGGMDLLLSHQAQRLEDIANNSISYLRINLLTLGLLTPIISVLLDSSQSVANVFTTHYGFVGLSSWVLSMVVCTHVYRSARRHSTKQFKPLEDSIEEYENKASNIAKSIADGNDDYEQLSEKLLRRMSFGVSASFVSILLLITAFMSNFLSPNPLTVYIFVSAGFLAVLGVETIKDWVFTPVVTFVNYFRRLIPQFEFNLDRNKNSRKFRIANSFLNFIAEFNLDKLFKSAMAASGIQIEKTKSGSVQVSVNPMPIVQYDEDDWGSSLSVEFANNGLEFESIQLGGKIASVEDMPPIRSRLLAAIWHIVDDSKFTITELKEKLEETDIPATKTILGRLMEDGYIQRIGKNRDYFFVDEYNNYKTFSADDISEKVEQRIQRFIDHKNSEERVEDIASEVLDVEKSEIEEHLESLNSSEKAQELSRIVEKLEEENIEPKGYDKMGWRSLQTKYQLTEKSKNIINSIENSK